MADLTTSQRILIDDGLPPAAIMDPTERSAAWKGHKFTKPRDLKVPAKDEDAATKQLRKEVAAAEAKKKAERFARLKELKPAKTAKPTETTMIAIKTNSKTAQVAKLRLDRAAAKGPKQTQTSKRAQSASKAERGKKATKAKARTPADPKAASGAPKGVRPGSKLAIVVGLLTRKEGCTTADVLKATEWPAVSMPQQARAAGLKLRQEKDGKVTRYWAS